jgi:hypothetical protein
MQQLLHNPYILFLVWISGTGYLGRVVAYHRGPFAILKVFRSLFGIDHNKYGVPIGYPDTELGKMFKCPWCIAPWISVLTGITILIQPVFMLPFSCAAFYIWFTILIEKYLE